MENRKLRQKSKLADLFNWMAFCINLNRGYVNFYLNYLISSDGRNYMFIKKIHSFLEYENLGEVEDFETAVLGDFIEGWQGAGKTIGNFDGYVDYCFEELLLDKNKAFEYFRIYWKMDWSQFNIILAVMELYETKNIKISFYYPEKIILKVENIVLLFRQYLAPPKKLKQYE